MADRVLDFRLLGTMEVRRNGAELALGGAKQRTLLAVLLINANRVVTTDDLVESLWPDKAPGRPLTAIQGYVSALRRILDSDQPFDVIVTEAAGYRLAVPDGALDVERLESLTRKGRAALADDKPEVAAAAFSEAVGLFRGPPLADFTYEAWASAEIGRLEDRRLLCLEERIEADLRSGRHAEVVGELESLVASHPLRERMQGQLMLALYRADRQVEALAAYQEARDMLVEELGVDPSDELQKLQTQILNHDPALSAPARTQEKRAEVRLPSPVSAFIGREPEVAEVVGLLGDQKRRLVTLTGPGGTGKTRLAREAAAGVRARFPDGVYWVSLSQLRDPALVMPTVANALGAADDLPGHLGHWDGLIVLDNFEQVVGAAGEVSALLQDCEHLALLVTSREVLRVDGETEYQVPPLTDSDAVALFCERSRHRPSAHIAELCSRLDSLPLAIELAAARTKALSPAQVLDRLSERLDLLTGRRDAESRHETLRATIEWSYQLLSTAEQELFAKLSVFSGGCTLDAAAEVCDADIDTLQSLVEKSLLRFGGERYSMLETLRGYAADVLSSSTLHEAATSRHAWWAVTLAKTKAARDTVALNLEELDIEHDNLRLALATLRARHDSELEPPFSASLGRFRYRRGYLVEGLRDVETTLSSDQALLVETEGDLLRVACFIASELEQYELVDAHAQKLLELSESAGITDWQAEACAFLGAAAANGRQDLATARMWIERQIELSRDSSDHVLLGEAISGLAALCLQQGDVERSVDVAEEAIVALRAAGESDDEDSDSQLAMPYLVLAQARLHQGKGEEAWGSIRKAAMIDAGRQWPAYTMQLFETAAAILSARGDFPAACRAFAGAQQIRADTTVKLVDPTMRDLVERESRRTREALGDEFQPTWSEGLAVSPRDGLLRLRAIG